MGLLAEGVENIIKKTRKSGVAKKILEDAPAPKLDLRGYNLFDYKSLGDIDQSLQKDLLRKEARRVNVPPNDRTKDLLDSRYVMDSLINTIKKGADFKDWYDITPFKQAFLDANPNPEDFLRFLDYQTIASARNQVPQQLKAGSYLYHLDKMGAMPAIEHAVQFPPGYGGLSQGSIGRIGQETYHGLQGLDPVLHPKRTTYVTNWNGNLRPVTADTHAVRLPAMLSGDPRWIATTGEIKEGGKKIKIKPRSMVDEGIVSMEDALKWPGIWEAAPQGAEYKYIEQLYQKAAEKAGMHPAQAQAAAWVAGGKLTGLRTKPGLFLQAIEDRVKETAKILGKTPSAVIKDIALGKYPLKEIMVGTGIGAASLGSDDAEAAVHGKILKELKTAVEKNAPLNEIMDVFRKQIADPNMPKVFDQVGNKYGLPQEYSDILNNYRVSTPDIKEVGTDPFYDSIIKAKNANDYGAAVYAYPKDEYNDMRKFMVDDNGGAGYALKKDDIVSVFKNPDSDYRHIAPYMVLHGVEEGGRRLDAFDTALPNIYSKVGFRESARLPWHEPSAPQDWKKGLFSDFNKGEPDVVFMHQDLKKPSKVMPVHKGSYDSARNLADGYDEAVAAQIKAAKDASVLSAAMMMPSGEPPERGPDGFRGPVYPWLAAISERLPAEGLFGSPSTKSVIMDMAYGNVTDYWGRLGAAMELVDPTTWGYGVGVQPKKRIR